MANYVVGDIQGCFDEFYEGLNVIKFNKSKDFLWVCLLYTSDAADEP